MSASMASKEIELQSHGAMPAYVSEPTTTPRGGVVVIQEIFGITQPMKDVADLLASAGYLAIVPAMYHRADPHFLAGYDDEGRERGLAALRATTRDDVIADLSASVEYLRAKLDGANIATWGFCWGGTQAFVSATLPHVAAAVCFYGGQIAKSPVPGIAPAIELVPHIEAPLLLAFGGKDDGIPQSDVATIERTLGDAGKTFEIVVYPDVGHAFFRAGPASSESAADAWKRVGDFLRTHVG